MKILIACECSGIVRDAFRKRGHDAISCDLKSTEIPGPHYQGNVFDLLDHQLFDMMICFPECRFLCSSGLHWNHKDPFRSLKTAKAVEFATRLWKSDIPKIAMENSIGCLSTYIRKPDQIIQPYNFGHNASKATCLWLKGLPLLQNTKYFRPRIVNGKKRWANQTDSGQNRLGPSPERSANRARTYQGIADAMADQWRP